MANTTAVLPALDMSVAAAFPLYYSPRADLVDWMSDANLSLLAPIVAYVRLVKSSSLSPAN